MRDHYRLNRCVKELQPKLQGAGSWEWYQSKAHASQPPDTAKNCDPSTRLAAAADLSLTGQKPALGSLILVKISVRSQGRPVE